MKSGGGWDGEHAQKLHPVEDLPVCHSAVLLKTPGRLLVLMEEEVGLKASSSRPRACKGKDAGNREACN